MLAPKWLDGQDGGPTMGRDAKRPHLWRAEETTMKTMLLPLLPLRDIVVFPESLQALFVGRPRSVAALEAAIRATGDTERRIVLSAQRTAKAEEPGTDDIHAICAVGVVRTLLPLQN